MTLVRKIAYNTVISTGARLIGVALSLISIGLIARYLGNDGFGSYSLILAFLYIFDSLADLGLYSLMVREISRTGIDEKKVVSNIFTIRTIALLVFMGIAMVAVWFFPYSTEVKIGTMIVSFSFLFLAMGQVLMGIFQKYLRTDKSALADVVARIVQLGLIIACVKLGVGFYSVISVLAVSGFVNCWS